MLLRKIFKPKWQHSKAEIRSAAIAQLDWNSSEERKILESAILRDPEPNVVKLALDKVNSAKDLLSLNRMASKENSGVIRTKLIQLVENAESNIAPFIDNITNAENSDTLLELATELKADPSLPRLLNAFANHSPQAIVSLVINHPLSQLRQMAADLIEDPELLTDIASKIKSKDKGVFQKVRAKLQAQRQKNQDLANQITALENLCASLEAHAETDATKYYIEKLEALQRIYSSNEQQNQTLFPPNLVNRIETALRKCKFRAAELEQLIEADNKQQQAIELQTAERLSTIVELERTSAQLKESSKNDSSELAALDGLIKTQENRWLEATKLQVVSKQEQKAYQYAMSELRQYYNARKNLNSHESEIEELLKIARSRIDSASSVDKDLLKKLRKCINKIEWPEGFCLPDLLEQSVEIAGQIQNNQTQHTKDLDKQKKKVREKIDKLARNIDNGELKSALRLAKDIHSELIQFPLKIRNELHTELKAQQSRIDELKDWQGFATRPKQENLCERMGYLANQHLEPHIKAQRIKELQNEWRSLGGSPDQKLWQKFKNLSDIAFEPCKEFFGEEDKLKEANLQKRNAICIQLEEFTEQLDWNAPDWKTVDKINKKAREEWRLYYPVDHKLGKSVQQRFNNLLAVLDDKLRKEKEKNHHLKRDIVDQARSLLALEDIREATSQAKALQKQWQLIGITDHKKDRELWSFFREACDNIFNRLEERHKERKVEQENAFARANELLQATEDLQKNIDDSTELALNSLVETFNQMEGMSDAHKGLSKSFQEAAAKVREAIAKQKAKDFGSYYSELIKQAFTRSGRQITADVNSPSITETDHPNSTGIRLRAEHQTLINKIFAPSTEEPASDILLKMEIMAEIESPNSEKGRRMALQVARLTEGLQNGVTTENKSLHEQLEAYLTRWIELSQPEDLTNVQRRRLLAVLNKITDRMTE